MLKSRGKVADKLLALCEKSYTYSTGLFGGLEFTPNYTQSLTRLIHYSANKFTVVGVGFLHGLHNTNNYLQSNKSYYSYLWVGE